MLKQQEVLKELGYDLKNPNTEVMIDVLSEVMCCLDEYDEGYVQKLVNNPKSFIYVELGYFIYETGLESLHKSLRGFQQSINPKKVNKNLKLKVHGKSQNGNVYQSIFLISKYIKSKSRIAEVLQELGYDMDNQNRGAMIDIISEVMRCMSKYDEKDIEKIVYHPRSFIYETGPDNLHSALNDFQQSIKPENVNEGVNWDVYGEMKEPSVYESIFLISKYIKEQSIKKRVQSQMKVKTQAVN